MFSSFKLFSGYQQVPPADVPNPNETIQQMNQLEKNKQNTQQQQQIPGSAYMIDGVDPLADLAALEKMSQQQQQPSRGFGGMFASSASNNNNNNSDANPQSKSWFSSLFSSTPQHDEMNLQYDIESGQSAAQVMQQQQDNVGQEQQMGFVQRNAVKLATFLKARIEPYQQYIPELTYTQRLICFMMFAFAGIILVLNSLTLLPQIFLPGRTAKFAWSFSVANIFFTVASLFLIPYQSLFVPQRRFTTILYFSSIIATIMATIYLEWAIFVFPVLALQCVCLVLNVISVFSSAVNIQTDISQALFTSMFTRR